MKLCPTIPRSSLSGIDRERRDFLRLAALGGASLLTPQIGLSQATPPQPNLVFVLSDDQDWTGTSVRMHPDVPGSASSFYRTPNLEDFARQGMRFSSAYAPAPVCSPTRYSLQTGKSPAQLHWTKAGPVMTAASGYKLIPPTIARRISSRETTIGEVLQRAGYATAHYGKWHLSGGGPERHGYDEHDGDTSNRDAAPFKDPNPVDIFGITERASAFMEKNTKEKRPFFMQLSHHALHYPENARQTTLAAYRQRTTKARQVERGAITEDLDTGFGLLLRRIDELGITDCTYVVYMSDNGGGGGGRARPLRGGKGSLWEGGIRVPLIVRGPGIKADTFCHVPVVGYDLLPTFCELAGVKEPLPPRVAGGSMADLLRNAGAGGVRRPHEGLVFHFPHYQGTEGPHSAIRVGDHKLIRFYETGQVRLFDLAKDLGERHDLAKELPEKVAELTRRLDAYLTDVGAQMPTPNPAYDPNRKPVAQKGPRRKRR